MKKFFGKLDGYFEITKRGSTWLKEILGGVLVFFAMIYILPVNSSILGTMGIPTGAVFAATAICSGLCCLLMGGYARFPVALSAGMGMNAYLAFTVCGQLGYTWQEGLAVVIVSGILFFVFTLTPVRRWIIDAIPRSLKYTISAGLGAFICFVGLKMGGIIVGNSSTLVSLGNFNPQTNGYALLALGGVILVFMLMVVPNQYVKKFAILIAMVVVAIIGLILNACGIKNMPSFDANTGSIADIGGVFGKGFLSIPDILVKPQTYGVIFSFIMVNLFDTTATIITVGEHVGMVDKETGKVAGKAGSRAFIADASGALISGVFGTSPVTSFAESTVGVEFGARTGVSAITTGLLFFLSLAIFPAFNVFAGIQIGADTFTPCSSLALVAVGALMFSNLRNIEWDDKILVFSCFITFIMIILTYSITDGIAFGMIFYALMRLVSGHVKDTSPVIWVLGVIFLALFVVNTVIANLDSGSSHGMILLQSIAEPIKNLSV